MYIYIYTEIKEERNSCLFYLIVNIYIFKFYFFSGPSVQTRPRKLSYWYITVNKIGLDRKRYSVRRQRLGQLLNIQLVTSYLP